MAGAFEGHQRVLEGGRLGTGSDGLDLGPVLLHPGVERRTVVLGADLAERRQGEGQSALARKWIAIERREVGSFGWLGHVPDTTDRG